MKKKNRERMFQQRIAKKFLLFLAILLLILFFIEQIDRAYAREKKEQSIEKEQSFSDSIDRRKVSYNSSAPFIKICAVGDLMLSARIIDVVERKGVDYCFDSTRSIIQKADIAIANLEAPLTKIGTEYKDKTFTFKVPPHFISGISNSGFDVVTLANNHILDYGCEGLINTINELNKVNIVFCGAGENKQQACSPKFVECKGFKVAFVGFSMVYPEEFWAKSNRCGTCYPSESDLEILMQQCENEADLTIVSFHWGAEKRNSPKDYQINYAHRAIDFGADLVLGHHPHVLQGLEVYKGRLIAYSLGNYIFGSLSETARTSAILNIMLDSDKTIYARVIPINVHNETVQYQPKVCAGKDKTVVLNQLNDYSLLLNQNQLILDENGYVLFSKNDRFYGE